MDFIWFDRTWRDRLKAAFTEEAGVSEEDGLAAGNIIREKQLRAKL